MTENMFLEHIINIRKINRRMRLSYLSRSKKTTYEIIQNYTKTLVVGPCIGSS